MDGSFINSTGEGATVLTIRNSPSTCPGMKRRYYEMLVDEEEVAEKMEWITMNEVVQWEKQLGYHKVNLESDCKNVIK